MSVGTQVLAETFKYSGRAVSDDGTVNYLSVTALKMADLCVRKWWFRYVKLLKDKESDSKKKGNEVHGEIEHYLKTGQDVLGPIARPGLKYMPDPAEYLAGNLLVEHQIDRPRDDPRGLKVAGIPLSGKIDLGNLKYLSSGLVELTDWKSSKDLDKWMPKPADLANPKHEHGIQMLGYGEWAFLQWADKYDLRTIRLRHVYMGTKETRAEPVLFDAPVQLVRSGWQAIQRVGERVLVAARTTDAGSVPRAKSDKACRSFGGCPYIGPCTDKGERLKLLFHNRRSSSSTQTTATEVTKMGFLDDLMSGNSQPAAPAAPTAPAAPIQTQAPAPSKPAGIKVIDESTTPDAVLKAAQAQKAAAATQAPAPTAGKWVQNEVYNVNGVICRFLCLTNGDQGSFLPLAGGVPILIPSAAAMFVKPATEAELKSVPAIVTPPDMPASNPALASKSEANELANGVATPATTPPAVPAAEGSPPATPAAAPAKPRASRTRKAQGEASEQAQNAPAVQNSAPAATQAPAADGGFMAAMQSSTVNVKADSDSQAKANGAVDELCIYMGCTPADKPAELLNHYVEELCSELIRKAQINLVDIRLATGEVLGFGKWKGALAAAAKKNPPAPGHYVVLTYGDERIDTVFDALAHIADRVTIRAGR